MFKNSLIAIMMTLLLTACAPNTVPMQPNNEFYNANLTVNKPYEIPGNFFLLGFSLPATSYSASMQDQDGKGVYFSSAQPLMAHDPLAGTVYRTGGIYYQRTPSPALYLYLVDTKGFAGVQVLTGSPLTGLNYKISKK
jgi:hypothetical protein